MTEAAELSREALENENKFLAQQLEGAVSHLRTFQGQCVKMTAQMQGYERAAAQRYEAELGRLRQSIERGREIAANLFPDALRYRRIRQHMVQVMGLGIWTSGENLDQAIDRAMQELDAKRIIKPGET